MIVPAASLQRTLTIRPWPDPRDDTEGHDPRSGYVEHYWLGILGPTATWLLRYLAARFDEQPAGFPLDAADTARSLGLGVRTGRRGAPLQRTLERCGQFGLARLDVDDPAGPGEPTAYAVRRTLPWLTRNQVARLPTALQLAHAEWIGPRGPAARTEHDRARARRLALSLLELGEDVETTERQLQRWRYHPLLCREAAAWAWDRHRQALAAAEAATAS